MQLARLVQEDRLINARPAFRAPFNRLEGANQQLFDGKLLDTIFTVSVLFMNFSWFF